MLWLEGFLGLVCVGRGGQIFLWGVVLMVEHLNIVIINCITLI